jgi:hypothetical protein
MRTSSMTWKMELPATMSAATTSASSTSLSSSLSGSRNWGGGGVKPAAPEGRSSAQSQDLGLASTV